VAELKEISPVQASQADVAPLIKLLDPVVLPRTIQVGNDSGGRGWAAASHCYSAVLAPVLDPAGSVGNDR